MKQVKLGLHIIFQLGIRVVRLGFIFAALFELFTGGVTIVVLFNLLVVILLTLEIKPITVTQHIQAHDVTISGNTIANQYGAPCKCRCGHGAEDKKEAVQPGRGAKN